MHGGPGRPARLSRPDGDAVTVATDRVGGTAGAAASGGGDVDVLSLRNVSSAYGPYRALFDVSFRVPAGGVVALVGSNGAGKSTVARTVTGLVTASAGQVALRRTGRDQPPRVQDRPARHGPRGGGPGRVLEPHRGGEPDPGLPPAGRAGQAPRQPRAQPTPRSPFSGNGGARWRAPCRVASSACCRWPRSWWCRRRCSWPTSCHSAWPRSWSTPSTRVWRDQPQRDDAGRRGAAGPPSTADWPIGPSCWIMDRGLRGRARRRRQGGGGADGASREGGGLRRRRGGRVRAPVESRGGIR